jgi:phage gpG-like protein
MPDLNDLHAHILALKADLLTRVPREIAQDMHDDTMRNFENESYNDGWGAQPWKDRPFEKQLTYKKLDYTGRLKNSIRPKSYKRLDKAWATIGTNVPYAKAHNEGGLTPTGDGLRRPPYTTGRLLSIGGSRVAKRQFMGIGTRTIVNAHKRIKEAFKRYL